MILKLFGICIMKCNYRWLKNYSITNLVILIVSIIGWGVYGNVIFFSDKNECGDLDETRGMDYLMLFFLIVGYL